ncbi:endonuclease [Fimbriiglobus ruber]|uniref:Endonuclease III n=1 Tax=Fimbriiglobus ruber TaxID=1908690 RepID=A0A225DIE1_9BACT|nr:endonuclease [Fimbriiglobus ruber]OWK35887.1 Endonuclease III [Fimbriiglobus ruber]
MPATMNKQQLLNQTLTLLKKKFPAPPEPDKRPVLEEVVYAICREGVPSAKADAAYARMRSEFFDWNEVRVSTIQEVANVFEGLPDAGDRAKRVVEFLQEHFERTYSFELDDLEKKGLKQAAKQLARYKDKGVSDFVVAWVTQRSLGGHAVPLDEPTLRVLRRLNVIEEGEIDDLEAVRGSIEHFIPKAKGFEFTEEMIQLADAVCVADTPHCPHCPLKADCPTGIENLSKPKAAADKPKPKSR